MTGDPATLIAAKRSTLNPLCAFAVGDASRFNGSPAAKAKELELRNNSDRLKSMKAADQAGSGVIHYIQSKLKSSFDQTMLAHGAVCTTFAICAAHILTDGVRQHGSVRVEIIGVDRQLGTHMYVVCGRAGNRLSDLTTWGSHATIVDLWAAAMAGNNNFDLSVATANASNDWRLKGGVLGQFYDNARQDPLPEELGRSANPASLDRTQKERELNRAEEEFKTVPAFDKERTKKLTLQIGMLKKELGK